MMMKKNKTNKMKKKKKDNPINEDKNRNETKRPELSKT